MYTVRPLGVTFFKLKFEKLRKKTQKYSVCSFKGSVSRDFLLPFFSWFKPIWAPDKQISPKFENALAFWSGAQMKPKVTNISLAKC